MTNQLSVAVCGCTINSEKYIIKHLDHIFQLSSLFKNLDVLVYENDSTDNTVAILQKLHKENKIKLISETGVKNKIKGRTNLIAHGRNKLLNSVRKGAYDYMIMIDMDSTLKNPIIDSVKRAFKYDTEKWDVLTGNCPNSYYDVWALRIDKKQWSPIHAKIWNLCPDYDVWDMIYHRSQMGFNETKFHIQSFQKNIHRELPLIAVNSAFNGIGIYNTSILKDCNYNGTISYCTCEKYNVQGQCYKLSCEHVSFHRDIINKNNGKIYICPSLLIPDQYEHLQ